MTLPRSARPIAAEPGSGAYRPDIDGLRAIAILAVVAFHAFPETVGGGFVGVDVFFVISGYLISSIILRAIGDSTFSFGEFYARRARRLLPSLCIVVATVLAAGWFVLLPAEYRLLGRHAVAAIAFASNFLLWSEAGYFDAAADTKPMLHLWSLGIEEQFYIVWPLLLWFARKRNIDSFRLGVVLAFASFLVNVCCVIPFPSATFYFPVTRFWEILAGGLLAQAGLRGWLPAHSANAPPRLVQDVAATGGLLLIAAAVLLLNNRAAFPGWWAILPVAGAALVIGAGPDARLNRHFLANPVMLWIGLISYPLYLWHWPLLSFLRICSGDSPTLIFRFAAVASSVLLAWLTYRLIDRPVRSGRLVIPKLVGTGLAAVFVATAGAALYASQGIPRRFGDSFARLANYHYDYRADYREGSCFLRPEQDASAFGECSSNPGRKMAHSIVLWGDSHAAHLYPGLKSRVGTASQLVELTSSSCPPILGLDVDQRPHCVANNDFVLKRIIAGRPDRVLLAANWPADVDQGRLADTIRALRASGIERISLIGPVPHWRDGLPRALLRHTQRDVLHRLPERMTEGLILLADVDEKLRRISRAEQVDYVSPRSLLCDEEGCLTRTDGADAEPIAWDEAHLTAAGSRYLVGLFPASTLE